MWLDGLRSKRITFLKEANFGGGHHSTRICPKVNCKESKNAPNSFSAGDKLGREIPSLSHYPLHYASISSSLRKFSTGTHKYGCRYWEQFST